MAPPPSRRGTRRRARPRRLVAAPTSSLVEAVARACASLEALDAPFALVGGLAVSARAEPRLTRDIDVALACAPDQEDSIVSALGAQGYRVSMILEQSRAGRLATVRLAETRSAVLLDLLFASSGIEPEIVAAAEPLEILGGLTVPVARIGHLIAMKVLAADARTRPQDFDDIRALITVASAAELRRVPPALRLIEKRGFARRRDLIAAWRKARASAKPGR